MQERGEGGGTRGNILLLPRDLEIERQLQKRLDGHKRFLEDPNTDTLPKPSAVYEIPIMERLLRVGSVNFEILQMELERSWGEGYSPELFTAASASIRTVLSGEGVQ